MGAARRLSAGAGNLPFTAYDITGAVLMGNVLLGAGALTRRMLARRAHRGG